MTKIKRVEVQIESDELKTSYRQCVAQKEAFYGEVVKLEQEVTQVKGHLLAANSQCEDYRNQVITVFFTF